MSKNKRRIVLSETRRSGTIADLRAWLDELPGACAIDHLRYYDGEITIVWTEER